MAQKISPVLALRSSSGIAIWRKAEGLTAPYEPAGLLQDESKICRAVVFSPDSRHLAWSNGATVQIAATADWKVIASLPRPKAFYVKFSPLGTYLMTWEIFTTSKDRPDGSPNLYVYRAETGEQLLAVIQKRQIDWEPHWSSDESILAMMIGGEVLFYEVGGEHGFEKPARKLGGGRNGSVSLSPGSTTNVAFYVPGVKGAPSICRIFRYPNVDAAQPIASKSFFQADNVQMMWNEKGTGLLLLTSTDVDATGVSYYGKQALHFLNVRGDSFAVQLNAEGPIHAVAWSPRSTEFCVVYGFIPAKATLFNLKCDPIFEFGTGVRNAIYFNAFGNLILFGGFGNLRGNIEVWDLARKLRVAETQAPDTTLVEWAPTGDVYLTATCAPRLRMGNGFKVWHYSGALLHEALWPEKQELYEVVWQRFAPGTFLEPTIADTKVQGIQSSQPTASKQKYVPPCIRDNPAAADEKYIPGLPPGYRSGGGANAKKQGGQQKTAANGEHKKSSVDQERQQKIQKVNKKLKDIRLLKEKQSKGEKLDVNQQKKIESERELIKELKALKLAGPPPAAVAAAVAAVAANVSATGAEA